MELEHFFNTAQKQKENSTRLNTVREHTTRTENWSEWALGAGSVDAGGVVVLEAELPVCLSASPRIQR